MAAVRRRRRRPHRLSSSFDGGLIPPSDPYEQRLKAQRTYRVAKHAFRLAQKKLGPKGRRFEGKIGSRVFRVKKSLKKVLKPPKKKPAGEW